MADHGQQGAESVNIDDISNTQLANAIDEWVHSERDRKILKKRLIDGICYEP